MFGFYSIIYSFYTIILRTKRSPLDTFAWLYINLENKIYEVVGRLKPISVTRSSIIGDEV